MFASRVPHLLAISAACLIAVSSNAVGEQAWKVQLEGLSGSKCFDNDAYRWVREDAKTFRIFDSINRKELMSAPLRPDGSAEGMTTRESRQNRIYKIVLPAGSGPRKFELTDQNMGCRFAVTPMGPVR